MSVVNMSGLKGVCHENVAAPFKGPSSTLCYKKCVSLQMIFLPLYIGQVGGPEMRLPLEPTPVLPVFKKQ